jgi:tetratricopeptide (TPR) repeat protein
MWALCQSDEILRESFNPFRYWLRRYFDQSEAQSEPRNKRNFNRTLDGLIDDITDDGLAAELDRTRSFLAAMLDLYWPDSLYAGLDAPGRYENTMLGLLALMKAESQRQPLIIQLEDMHLIDEASRELVVRLADALKPSDGETYPIALIATARREGSGFPLSKDDLFWEMDLSQLSRESLRDLAQDMLGGTVAESLLDVIESQAEGNPFFVEQILRYLIESDLLTDGANGWQVRQEQRRLLPEDVRSVLVARLDRLAQEVKDVVQTAAVLGREFEVMLLISMLRDEPATRQKITAAEEAAIWSALSQLRYIFKHAMLRDTAYRMQVRVRRQLLHKLAADAIEILYEEDLSAHYGELGYHSERAGLLEAASDWYMLAANQALNRGTLLDARSYLERAEALIPTSDLNRRWTVHSRQVEILSALGDAEACLEAATNALAVAQELDDMALIARAYLTRGSTAYNVGDDPRALIAFEAGLEAARQSGAHSVEAIILSMKTLTLARMGRMEDASISAEGALLMAEESGNEAALVRTLNNLANFNMFLSDYGRSAEFLARQIKINRRQTDRVGEVHGLTNLAYNLLAGGRYEDAREAIEQALQLSMSMGALRLTAYNRLNLGLAWTRLGQPAEALLELETAQQLLSSIDDKFAGAVSHTYMGLTLEVDGQTDQAAEAFELAAELMGDIGASGYAMDATSGCGRCALLSEDNSRAAELAGKVWTYLREAGASGLEFPMLAYESCARVFERTGNLEGYRAAVETGYGDLMSRAQKISDDAWRSSYLHNVPENRALVDRWEQLTE